MALPPLDIIEFETKLNLVADDDKPAASKPKPRKTSPPPKQQPSSSPSSPNLRARSRDPTGYIQTANTAQAIDCMTIPDPSPAACVYGGRAMTRARPAYLNLKLY